MLNPEILNCDHDGILFSNGEGCFQKYGIVIVQKIKIK